MSLFKKSKDKIDAEKLYDLLSNKTQKYTIDEIKDAVLSQGYNQKVTSLVVKMIQDNKLPLKDTLKKNTTELSKEQILKELSYSIKNKKEKISVDEKKEAPLKKEEKKEEPIKKEEPLKKEEKKKNLTSVSKVGFLTKIKDFFRMIYFFFEDIYYSCVDGISKILPINKLTDKIDKKFPSFILFLILLVLLLYLIISGTLSFSKTWTISVEVYDQSNTPVSEALVSLQIKDKEVSSLETNIFGEVIFRDLKSRKQNVKLIVSKEHYNTKEYEFKLNKNNLRHIITLTIDTENPIIPVNPAQERDIIFVENNDILINNVTLNTTFSCTNTEKQPEPRTTLVSTGKVLVKTPAGCGSLRVSVTSTQFNSITNQVVPENNKIVLIRINNDKGTLGISVKNISNNPLSNAQLTVYNYSQSTPLLPFDSTTTDIYGVNQFNLEPKQYLVTAAKEGYLTYPRKGPFSVVKDNTTNVEFILFTIDDLLDFDCSQDRYKPFCINNQIDCSNQHLKPFLHFNEDGSCSIGIPGYIDVTLLDSETEEPVFADITLEYKLKDSNESYSSLGSVLRNKSHAIFDVLDFYTYRVRVLNTEENGYLQPDPVLVDGIDKNIIVYLEYSSELNSGVIGVNVKNQEINVNSARVYLYREFEDDFVLVNQEPKYTNQFGDVNFTMQRANREYYAYAIHSVLDKQGVSEIERLDVNSFLKLDVNLLDIPKTLNLKVNPNISYDINFYTSQHLQINEYVTVDVDNNKQYTFTGENINKVYAVISADGYTTYQTELINLVSGVEIFKEITLLSLTSCSDGKIEVLGLFDKTGSFVVNNIDFIENGLSKEYRIKLKYISCLKDSEIKLAHIRAGNKIFINEDSVSFVSEDILSQDIEVKRGYRFSGEHVPDFNTTLFQNNYNLDKSLDYNLNNYKWLEIDFRELKPQIIEFSLNIKFKETPIAPIENYIINYRALSVIYGSTYSYDPELPTSWNQIPFYPEGYFYAKTNKYQIPFSNSDYIYNTKIKDINNSVLPSFLDGHKIDINSTYKYDLEYIYLKSDSRTGNILQTSSNTNNNLKYLSYGYTSSLDSSPGNINNIYNHISVEDTNYSLLNIDAQRGYLLKKYTLFKPEGFFEIANYSEPRMITNILNNFPLINTKLYAYNSDEKFLIDISPEQIFVGSNNLSFKVLDDFGSPVNDVSIKYQIQGVEDNILLGKTNQQGILNVQELIFNIQDMSKKVTFSFIFDASAGIPGNTIRKEKIINSGFMVPGQPLNFSTYYLKVNDRFVKGEVSKEYEIEKKNTLVPSLENISFIPNEVSYFEVEEINEYLLEENSPIPRSLSSKNTSIFTKIFLSDTLPTEGNLSTKALFRNELKFPSITQMLDVFSNVFAINLGQINYEVSFPSPKKGVFYNQENNNHSLELIKDLNPEIELKYLFSTSTSDIILEEVSFSSLPSFIDSDALEASIINFSNQPLNNLEIILNFKINENFNSYPSQEEIIIIDFKLKKDETVVSLKEIFNIKVFDKDSLVEITENTSNVLTIFCSNTNCDSRKTYNLRNLANNYDVDLLSEVSLNPSQEYLFVDNFSGSTLLSQEFINKTLRYYSNYSSLEETVFSEETNTIFSFNLQGLDKSFEKEKSLSYEIKKIDMDYYESDLENEFCVGVGGTYLGEDIFILGFCEEEEDVCYTGEDALPKVFFNWGEETESWTTKCIGDSLDNMSEKYACDSLQMLISIFHKIQDGSQESFYIKLMNDGISKDLLKDFIDYRENDSLSIYAKFNKPTNQDLFTEQAVIDDNFKISLDSGESVFRPGVYEVKVYGDEDVSYKNDLNDKRIDIRLSFERSIPSSELSVFHYMPLNGRLNNSESLGYGISISSAEGDEISINPSFTLENILKEDPITTLVLTNNNHLGAIKQTINSQGKILDLRKIQDFVQLEYTPSYPIPLYANIGCPLETNFSYNLYLLDNPLDALISGFDSSFLRWDNNISYLTDQLYASSIQGNRFVLETNNINDTNSISAMLYLPIVNDLPIDSVIFKTTGFNNNEYTKIFSKNNLQGTKDITFSSQAHVIGSDLENLKTIKGIFEYIKDEKACIFKSPTNTYVKWVEEEVNFTEEELLEIQENYSQDFICNTINNPIQID